MTKLEVIPQFEVIQGGKQEDIPITKTAAKGPLGPDWLRSLGEQVRFVCHGKNYRGCFLENYGIAAILDNVILLYNFLPQYGASPYLYVNSFKFSQDYVLDEILPNPPKEEENNEQHHLPVPEPREVDDGHEGPA